MAGPHKNGVEAGSPEPGGQPKPNAILYGSLYVISLYVIGSNVISLCALSFMERTLSAMPSTPSAHPNDGLADKSADRNVTNPAPTSIALIMAAGASRRFGVDDKRLAILPDGRHLLAATVALVAKAFPALRVVLREDDDPFALGLSADTPIIRAAHASEGLGASISDAFHALQGDDDLIDMQAAAILLGDMPALRLETLEALQRRITSQCIVRPVQAGRPGHPVLFGRAFWPELAALGGQEGGQEGGEENGQEGLEEHKKEGENRKDEGARSVIRANWEHAIELAVDDPGIHLDIDHSTDLRRLP